MHGTHKTIERLQETVNRLIAGILPFAIMGRDLTVDYAAPKQIEFALDDRTLSRAWDAVQFATDNAPEQAAIQPQLFDDTTRAVLRSYGLDRVDRSAQVFFLAQIVETQAKQLQHWRTEDTQRESMQHDRARLDLIRRVNRPAGDGQAEKEAGAE